MESLSPVNGYVRLGDLGLRNKKTGSTGTKTGKELEALDPFKEVIGCFGDTWSLEIEKMHGYMRNWKMGYIWLVLGSNRNLQEATRI